LRPQQAYREQAPSCRMRQWGQCCVATDHRQPTTEMGQGTKSLPR